MRLRTLSCGALAVCVGAIWSSAQAVTVTDCGPNVCYEYDDAQAAVGLFGLPTRVGDSMFFTPTVFRAESQDGVGIHSGTNTDSVAATFLFDRVYTPTGDDILSINVYEDGDYDITTDGRVGGNLYLRAFNLNNILQNTLQTDTLGPISGASGGLQLWSMSATVFPEAAFTTTADNLRLQIQNDLSAFTDANGERAWIQKKLTLTTTIVPVPAAVWLFGSALGLLGWVRRARGLT